NSYHMEYPMLIPGSHKVLIKVNDRNYYMFLVVTALHIEDHQLESMRKEVDKYIEGLAKETRSDLSMEIEKFGGIDIHHLISNFITNHKRIISSLIRIKNNPKYEIKREYTLKSKVESGKIDSKSIKHAQKGHDNPNEIL